MADVVGRAVLEIGVDTKELVSGLNQVNRTAADSAKQLRGMGAAINLSAFRDFKDLAMQAGDMIRRVAEGVVELGVRGAAVSDVRESFAGLAAGVNSTAAAMLDSLRRGVQGTINDFDLMQTANRALGAGLKLSASDMGTLAAGAKMLADRTGKDTKDAFDALTKAMITGRTKGLAEFGFAAKDGNAILGELTSQLKQAGPSAQDFADYVDQAKATLNNLRDSAGVVVARVLPDLLAQFKNVQFGSASFGDALKFVANVLANGLVNSVGIGVNAITGLVQAVTAAGTTISSQAEQMWGVLTGKTGVKEALQNIFALGTAGLKGIKDGLQQAISPTIQWKDYLAEAGRVSTVVATHVDKAGKKIKDTHKAVLLSSHDLSLGILADSQAEKKAVEMAAAAMKAAMAQAMQAMRNAQGAWYVETMNMASQAGFKTRAELEANAKQAEVTYQRMLQSGLYTTGELQRAHEAYVQAKQELDGTYATGAVERFSMIADSASSILRTMFGKNKAAAIAAALIDAAQAIVKVFSQFGWPWGIPMAAAIAVQTGMQINKIKSQGTQGFATGTAGLDFQNFGTVSPALLHGEEAVVPRGSGHRLAGEIAAALPKAGTDGAQVRLLRELVNGVHSLAPSMKRAFRDGLLLARA